MFTLQLAGALWVGRKPVAWPSFRDVPQPNASVTRSGKSTYGYGMYGSGSRIHVKVNRFTGLAPDVVEYYY